MWTVKDMQLELDVDLAVKGLSSLTTDYAEVMHDQYYTMLCSHYTMLLGGGGKV